MGKGDYLRRIGESTIRYMLGTYEGRKRTDRFTRWIGKHGMGK